MSQKFEKLKDGQLIELISSIGGKAKADISIYGQGSNYTTRQFAKMNLAIRGIDGQIATATTARWTRCRQHLV